MGGHQGDLVANEWFYFFQPGCFAPHEQLLSSIDSRVEFKSENLKFAIVTADSETFWGRIWAYRRYANTLEHECPTDKSPSRLVCLPLHFPYPRLSFSVLTFETNEASPILSYELLNIHLPIVLPQDIHTLDTLSIEM